MFNLSLLCTIHNDGQDSICNFNLSKLEKRDREVH